MWRVSKVATLMLVPRLRSSAKSKMTTLSTRVLILHWRPNLVPIALICSRNGYASLPSP